MRSRQKYPDVCTLIYECHPVPVQISRPESRWHWQKKTLIFSNRPVSNPTISARLYLPAPFGRGFLIFETRTVVGRGSGAGVVLGIDGTVDKRLGLALSIGVALGDDEVEDRARGLQLSIADTMAAIIADDSACAWPVLTDGKYKSCNKRLQTVHIRSEDWRDWNENG